MPTYEYSCRCCGHAFEAEQRITDDPLRDCEKCHTSSLERLVSGGAGVAFVGGGWARDLYCKPGQQEPSNSKPITKDGGG